MKNHTRFPHIPVCSISFPDHVHSTYVWVWLSEIIKCVFTLNLHTHGIDFFVSRVLYKFYNATALKSHTHTHTYPFPPHSLHWLFCLPCSQNLAHFRMLKNAYTYPFRPQSLQLFFCRLCWQILNRLLKNQWEQAAGLPFASTLFARV